MRCSWNVHLELHCLHQRHWNCGAVSGEEKLMAGESRFGRAFCGILRVVWASVNEVRRGPDWVVKLLIVDVSYVFLGGGRGNFIMWRMIMHIYDEY
ncbi:hypothetical protein F9C07_5721 [Aspergillus flavus]|uniref:Uncharacterized protein n=1 Tax=Aspergillus flavus (strain ATCC 200026 / FGSC A1120 / IAM 13836 / NRRL 3357 / JCM 12722 / SRRC 167) TaxID=332952 RepID=A0A7U2R174_ASPFN|nr:hypothetical protein F9C07_5721 [Aspergillus flavus]